MVVDKKTIKNKATENKRTMSESAKKCYQQF